MRRSDAGQFKEAFEKAQKANTELLAGAPAAEEPPAGEPEEAEAEAEEETNTDELPAYAPAAEEAKEEDKKEE